MNISKLSKRDKFTLLIGGFILFVLLSVQFLVSPLLDKRKKMEQTIINEELALMDLKELIAEYGDIHGESKKLQDRLKAQTTDFSLFAFLEKIAADSKVEKNIAYMKPSDSVVEGAFKNVIVEMKIQGIGLKQLVDFIGKIDSSDRLLAINKCSIQKSKLSDTLDVVIQVVSLEAANG